MAASAPSFKKYVVCRPFDYQDPMTGKSTRYEIDDPYDGPLVEQYLQWSDGQLIREAGPTAGDEGSEK